MVTKHNYLIYQNGDSSVLAKIFMVTKPVSATCLNSPCSVLAKIFMVTKHD